MIVRTKMYEPVSDNCVTTTTAINNPKYSIGNSFDQSDCDGESSTAASTAAEGKPERLRSPKRLPRRKKVRAPFKHHDSLDCCIFKNRISDGMRTGNGDKCIDIEHINLESERNYRNVKRSTIGTQTSQLIPYRLRFWPNGFGDARCLDGTGAKDRAKCCCRVLSQWCLSQLGLTIILMLWALLGAYAFYKTEGPREQEQYDDLVKLQNDMTIQLSTDLRQIAGHEESYPKTIQKYLTTHEVLILEAVSAGYGEGGGGSIWTYPGCILFAVSLLTTLGFGAPVPRTSSGRGVAVLFSAIGIPLHFLLIFNIGNLTAIILYNMATRQDNMDVPNSTMPQTARWLKWLPLVATLSYYLIGVMLFGFVRNRNVVDSMMFPLDFTAAGGVAKTFGHVRILYALYLEVAVTLAAVIVSLIQITATRGFVDVGLKLGLLTNT